MLKLVVAGHFEGDDFGYLHEQKIAQPDNEDQP
jgi:hypothetical protein